MTPVLDTKGLHLRANCKTQGVLASGLVGYDEAGIEGVEASLGAFHHKYYLYVAPFMV